MISHPTAKLQESRLAVRAVGPLVQPLLANSQGWRVVHHYRTCAYFGNRQGDILCLGSERIGRGPFTLSCSASGWNNAERIAGVDRLSYHRGSSSIRGNGLVVELGSAEIWQSSFEDIEAPLHGWFQDLELLARLARCEAPRESFGCLIPALLVSDSRVGVVGDNQLASALQRLVLVTIEALRQECSSGSLQQKTAPMAQRLVSLIGRGFGLTPSGDDFCAGFVLGLVKMQEPEVATKIAAELYEYAVNRTTAVSLAFFKALSCSCLSEWQTDFLNAFGSKQTTLPEAIAVMAGSGATSGWDLLAGFLVGAEIAGKHRRRQLNYPPEAAISNCDHGNGQAFEAIP